MPTPFIFNSTVYVSVPAVPGLPRPRAFTPLLHGEISGKYAGRKWDAYARVFHLMKEQAFSYLVDPYSFSQHTGILMQKLTVTFNGEVCLTIGQILCGWPIPPDGFWRRKLGGRPEYFPSKRNLHRLPFNDDCNGDIDPLPLRMFLPPAGNNKQRVWRVSATALPDSYCIFCPNGDQYFIHVAQLGQLILSSCPEHLSELLHLA